MIKNILILGAGSAGLIAALSLRRFFPQMPIRVVRSKDIGVIGVGEGTTFTFPQFLFNDLKLSPEEVYAHAQPTWKLGIRFLWGPRAEFFYTFSKQFNFRRLDLPKPNGFYCDEGVENLDVVSAMMRQHRALPRGKTGLPDFAQHQFLAFHIENERLVEFLEGCARTRGIEFTDGTVRGVERGAEGVAALLLESGERLGADLFVDCSGFRSELLGRTLAEPFRSFDRSRFCDRAVIGGWPRTDEIIEPYTTAETMEAGWCWRIEHERWINRGYVYASHFLSDDAALAEFRRKNPKVAGEPRVVKFRTGRYERLWVDNVVAIGNASGFVEPLEATALGVIVNQSRWLGQCLRENSLAPTPGMRAIYNRVAGDSWEETRDFIALHYAFNTRIETPFWRTCQAETDLGKARGIVEFYRENGPTSVAEPLLLRHPSAFGMEGYLAMLVGMRVPHQKPHQPAVTERETWRNHTQLCKAIAKSAFTVREGLDYIRQPGARWS